MWLVDMTRFGASVISITRLQALWLALKSLGFSVYSQNRVPARTSLTLQGRPRLRAGLVLGPVHFSCIPGRKGFQFIMVKSSFKRQSPSTAEPLALSNQEPFPRVHSSPAIHRYRAHTWPVSLRAPVPWFPSIQAFEAEQSSLRTYTGTSYLPLSHTNMGEGGTFQV